MQPIATGINMRFIKHLSIAILLSLLLAGAAGAAPCSALVFPDSVDYYQTPRGASMDEIAGASFGMSKTGSQFPTIKPVAAYGHDHVRLTHIHLNPGPVADSTGLTYGEGWQDSCAWFFEVMIIAFDGITPDTVTEDQFGVGQYIPHAALTGFLNPPVYRGGSDYSQLISYSRTFNAKECPTVTYLAIDADSIQIWVKKYNRATLSSQSLYFNFGRMSYKELSSGVPVRNWHIAYCDTVPNNLDFIQLAASPDTGRADVVFSAFDIGPRYTLASGSPADSVYSADQAFSSTQLEENFFCFRNTDPVIRTTLAATNEQADYFIINSPSYLDACTDDYRNCYPADRAAFSNVSSPFGRIEGAMFKPATNLPTDTNFVHSLRVEDSTGDSSGVRRMRLRDTGSGESAAYLRNYAIGDSVLLFGNHWEAWWGTEDVPFSGWYDSNVTPYLTGDRIGIMPVTAGIDSVSGTTRSHWTHYKCFVNQPRVYPKGFALWYEKSYDTQEAYTWRVKATTVYCTY